MITVLGAPGFIGRQLCERLRRTGREYMAPGRDEPLVEHALGDIIYCIGLTADFRTSPFDTVEAHVGRLFDTLQKCKFYSLLSLSSPRLYNSMPRIAREEDPIQIAPLNPDNLYNIS